MLSRSYSYQLIEFSDEQVKTLQAKLGDTGERSLQFIEDVRAPLSFYKAQHESTQDHPPPSRPDIKKRLKKLCALLEQLDETLSNTDLEGEYYYILEAQSAVASLYKSLEHEGAALNPGCSFEEYLAHSESCDIQAENDLERMAREARDLRKYLQIYIKHFRTNPRGRPRSIHEVLLMKEIGTLFDTRFGKLPASHTRGKFHRFIIELMKCAGFHQESWHRSIKPAIDELKNPPPED